MVVWGWLLCWLVVKLSFWGVVVFGGFFVIRVLCIVLDSLGWWHVVEIMISLFGYYCVCFFGLCWSEMSLKGLNQLLLRHQEATSCLLRHANQAICGLFGDLRFPILHLVVGIDLES